MTFYQISGQALLRANGIVEGCGSQSQTSFFVVFGSGRNAFGIHALRGRLGSALEYSFAMRETKAYMREHRIPKEAWHRYFQEAYDHVKQLSYDELVHAHNALPDHSRISRFRVVTLDFFAHLRPISVWMMYV